MRSKAWFSLFLALVMAASLSVGAAAAEPGEQTAPEGAEASAETAAPLPEDVAEDAWYAEAVRFVRERQLMSGVGAGRFDPNGTVTRGQVFQVLYNAAGSPAIEQPSTFTDLEGKWYADAAAWAQEAGLTNGVGGGLFAGDRAMTRQALAKALVDYCEQYLDALPLAYLDLAHYADAGEVASWAYGHMVHAVSLGILGGSGNQLAPTGTATRAQLAQMLLNMDALEATYVETEVEIQVPAQQGVPAHTIYGTLTTPTLTEGEVPAVVLLHGLGADREGTCGGFAIGAPYMATHGIASLRIDLIGSGASKLNYKNYHFTSAVEDARAAVDYLSRQEGIDGNAIGLVGWGHGGTIALLAAGQEERVRSVVTWGADADPARLVSTSDYNLALRQGYCFLEPTEGASLRVGKQWCQEAREAHVLTTFARSAAPVLAIHGAEDDTVPASMAEEIVGASADPRSRVSLLPDCGHDLGLASGSNSALSVAVFDSIDFLRDTLQ